MKKNNSCLRLFLITGVMVILFGNPSLSIQVFGQSKIVIKNRECLRRFEKGDFQFCDWGEPNRCLFSRIIEARDYAAFRCVVDNGWSPNVMSNIYNFPEIPLVKASLAGDIRILRLFPKNKTDFEIKDKVYGKTALLWLSFLSEGGKERSEGYYEITEFLIGRGANVNATGNQGISALMINSELGRQKYVDLLLAKGADPNLATADGRTALMLADDVPGIVKALIKANADPTIADKDGKTAMHFGMEKCHTRKFALLISATGKSPDSSQRRSLVEFSQKMEIAETCPSIFEIVKKYAPLQIKE